MRLATLAALIVFHLLSLGACRGSTDPQISSDKSLTPTGFSLSETVSPVDEPPPKKCNSSGVCSTTGNQGACSVDTDCRRACDEGRCLVGGRGRPCGTSSDWDNGECQVRRCNGATCSLSGIGALCGTDGDCTQKRCNGAVCTLGGIGDACTSDAACAAIKTCLTFVPQVGPWVAVCASGVHSTRSCTTTSDCGNTNKTCGRDGTCTSTGNREAVCNSPADCLVKRCRSDPNGTTAKCVLGADLEGQPCGVDAECNKKTCAMDVLDRAPGTCGLNNSSGVSCTDDVQCNHNSCFFDRTTPIPGGVQGECRRVNTGLENQCYSATPCRTITVGTPVETEAAATRQMPALDTKGAQAASAQLTRIDRSIVPSIGVKGAPLDIVVFQDLKCGMCRHSFTELIPHIQKDYVATGKARLSFIEFPLGQAKEETRLAAGALCANDQGEYMPMLAMLYKDMKTTSSEHLTDYAVTLGLDQKRFKACVDGQKYLETVRSYAALGKDLGVDGTPTFFINGFAAPGAMAPVQFDQMVERVKAVR